MIKVPRSCERCNREFLAPKSNVTKGNGRYCSRRCASLKGRTYPSIAHGSRFGRWTVIAPSATDRFGIPMFRCVCDCGAERDVRYGGLQSGSSQSCGCLNKEINSAYHQRHGCSKDGATPLQRSTYSSWAKMHDRCLNPNNKRFKYYGGRGISVCSRWASFEAFLEDMGEKPSLDHSIDRYPDFNGNYEPGNCRWATMKQQGVNKRSTRFVEIDGERVPLIVLSELKGININTLASRLKRGWDLALALATPAKLQRGRNC